ncbi:major allergen Pru av 1-like [Herrania umbratica]|uniref:Major allergen Pru av 1-like n=1 Tax=Herrania umbratica TaxID=108875 RepID=A0A6J1AV84_9ROSI|nr:major allergen Pru av 1-like [Herrania umbratica]
MGVVTYEMEVATSIPPAKMFKAFVLDADNLIPKVVPQAIKSSELLEGDGGPGSIKKITFGEGSQFKYVKHKIEGIDKENFSYSYSVIEGDALMNTLEKISYETKFVAGPDGGSVCKSTSKYYTIGDIEIKEEQIKAGKARALGMYKAVEAYLLANPDAYN